MTYQVYDGYDRRKTRPLITVRDLTREEVLGLRSGQDCKFIANDGTLRNLRVNGMVRTWKRDPNRIEVPVKYGLYECTTLAWTGKGLTNGVARMVKVVGEED